MNPRAAAPTPVPHPVTQLTEALVTSRNGQVDLQLNPEELGRIRMVMHTDGEVTRIQLTADRPETLDLLRRHAQELAIELRNAGLTTTSFSFGERAANGTSTRQTSSDSAPTAPTDAEPPPATRRLILSGSSLDLRL